MSFGWGEHFFFIGMKELRKPQIIRVWEVLLYAAHLTEGIAVPTRHSCLYKIELLS
jgi:hypothetical protein